MYIKKIIFTILFSMFFINLTYAQMPDVPKINAKNNAYRHNNKGLLYLEDKYYYGAIKEFQIAIDLNPSSQASAAYYANLGKTYEIIGYDNLAKPCYEKAVSLNVLSFDYYLKLAEIYKKLGMVDEKLKEFKSKTNSPLNEVMVGLLYIQKGQVSTGVTMLDDFCNKESKLIISTGIRNYLDNLVKEKL